MTKATRRRRKGNTPLIPVGDSMPQESGELEEIETDEVVEIEDSESHAELVNAKAWAKSVKGRPKEPMLIENILPAKPGEYIICAGGTGRGKTNLIINTAFSLATGVPFLDKFPCQECKVGLIFLEGDEDNLVDRYAKATKRYHDTDNLMVTHLYPESPTVLLKKIGEAVKGCRVVLIDGARYVVPGDYIKPRNCRDFTMAIREMLRQNEASGILTFQVTKAYARGLITIPDVYSVKGGTDLVDDATTVVLIEKTPNKRSSDELTVYFGKHRASVIDLEGIDVRFDRDTCTFKLVQDIAILDEDEKRKREDTIRMRY